MSDTDLFRRYVEAIEALSTVGNHQREALRRAVEKSTATVEQAKVQMADQQRMYDQARRDALHAEALLTEIRTILGVPRPATSPATSQAGTPLQLVEIRAQIRQVVSWTEETRAVAESLARTKARLANVAKPVQHAPTPAASHLAEALVRKRPLGIIAAIAVLTVIVFVVALIGI